MREWKKDENPPQHYSKSIGIAFVLVHWLIAAYALLGDIPSADNYHAYTMLRAYLFELNMPALGATHFFAASLISSFRLEAWTNYIYTIFAIIFCTFQWHLVGASLQFLIYQHSSGSGDQLIANSFILTENHSRCVQHEK